MKRLLTLLMMVLIAQFVWAQSPVKLSYQAVVRNSENKLVANEQITVEVSITDAAGTTTWYTETHNVTTNQNGMVSLMIGEGTPVSGSLNNVAWDNAAIKTSIGAGGDNIDNATPVTPMPYALFADSAKTVDRGVLKEQIHEVTDMAIANLNSRISKTIIKVDSLGQTMTDTLDYYATQKALNDTAAAIRSNMAAAQVNADWGETDENAASFIKNKPTDLGDFSNTPGYVTAFEVQEAANIPTKVSAFQNDAHYVNKDVDSLTYYAKLTDLPTVNDATLTIKQGDTELGTFTANAAEEKTITIPAVDLSDYAKTEDIPDVSGFLTTETDPNVPDWAKEAHKPAYDYSEIVNTPSLDGYLTSETDPTVNNSTITVKQGETTLGTFTTNAGEDVTIAIPEAPAQVQADWNATEGAAVILNKPTDLGDFTNTPGYVTAVDVAEAAGVPTKVSQLENDANYITAADIPAETDPTVNDATITFTQGESTLGSFTTNTGTATTIEIPAADLTGYAKTEDIPDVSGFLTEHQDLSEYAKLTDIPDVSGFLTEHQSLEDYAKTADVEETYAKKTDIPDVSGFLTEHQSLEDYAKTADVEETYAKKTDIPDVSGFLTEHQDLSEYAKLTDIPDVSGFLTEHQDLSEYAKLTDIPDVSGFLTEHQDLSDYAKKSEIPDVSGFLTEHQDLTDYAKKSEIPDVSGFLTSEADPTVKDATITFTQGTENLGSFTTNAGTDVTIEIPAAPAFVQTQADWEETDENAASFIKNKPDISATSDYNEACTSTTFCELVNTVNKLLATVDSLKDVISNLNNNATPTVTTTTTVNFDHGAAIIGGNVTNAGFGDVTERGICYGTEENPTIEGTKVAAAAAGTGEFTCNLTGLTTDQKYYARAYATNAAGTTYGDNVEFTIYTDPQLSMVEVTVNNDGTVTAKGKLVQLGVNDITELGICYGTNADELDPENGDHKAAATTAVGEFTVTLTENITAGTYYASAYALDNEGAYASEPISFTITAPAVTTGEANVVNGEMQIGGNLTALGAPAATEIGVCYGEEENPDIEDNKVAASAVAEGEFTVTATDITAGTTYYARAYATYAFGTVYGDNVTFSATAPTVTTGADPVVDNENQEVTVSGNVTDAGSADITKRGICYGTTAEPDTTNKVAAAAGTGEFSATLTDLTAGVTYYARAYAVNAFGIAYGEDVTFQLEVLTPEPVVTTGTATYNTATGNIDAAGEVVSAGLGGEVTERGICYSTSAEPTVDGSKVAAASAGTGEFNVTLTGLTQNTIYHLRAYATNAAGTSYGQEITVGAAYACGDKIYDIENNSYRTVKIGTQCWMQENIRVKKFIHPTSGDTLNMKAWAPADRSYVYDPNHYCYAEVNLNQGMGTEVLYLWGTATCRTTGNTSDQDLRTIRGLCPEGWHVPSPTEYLTLATEVDPQFTSWSQTGSSNNQQAIKLCKEDAHWKAFQNLNPQTGDEATTATWNTTVNSPGYAYANPTADTWHWNEYHFDAIPAGYIKKDGGTGFASAQAAWMQNGTLNLITSYGSSGSGYTIKIACYNSGIVRFSSGGEGYTGYSLRCVCDNTFLPGEDNNMPAEVYAPTVTTGAATLAGNEVTVTGNVTDKGGSDVTACGIYYGTTASPATTKVDATPGVGEFSCTLPTGLQGGVTYYARAFATNTQGTRYGEDVTFTLPLAEVTTGTASMDGMNMVVSGEVTDEGASTVTSRGICYGTSANPTTQVAAAEGGLGAYTVSISGLNNNTLYYLRAYATNSEGTVYGEDIQFTCTMPVPTVTTGEVTISDGDATVTGSITDDGGSEIQERGICYSTSENPTLGAEGVTAVPYESSDNDFAVTLSGLAHATTFYARAYATNESGTGYGEDVEVLIPFVCGTDKMVDIDGNEYTTVQIGTQCWMAENLRVKRFIKSNGDTATLVADGIKAVQSNLGDAESEFAYAEVSNSSTTVNAFPGTTEVFYPWTTATTGQLSSGTQTSTTRGLCPAGWHIPSAAEGLTLAQYIDGTSFTSTNYYAKNGNNVLSSNQMGVRLSAQDGHWHAYASSGDNNTGVGAEVATTDYLQDSPGYALLNPTEKTWNWNTTNFNAYPVGYIDRKNVTAEKAWVDNGTLNLWTAYGSKTSNCRPLKISVYKSIIYCYSSSTAEYKNGYSVRCVKD